MAFSEGNWRGALDPAMQIRAGPFISNIHEMLRHGWQFEISKETHEYDTYMVRAKNTDTNLVFVTSLRNGSFREFNRTMWLYFEADMIQEVEVARQMYMAPMAFEPVEVAKPMMSDMVIFTAHGRATTDLVVKPEELLVMPEDIPELMQKILKAQKPRAQEILADQRRTGKLAKLEERATILTFNR